jgi:hypothetical protein
MHWELQEVQSGHRRMTPLGVMRNQLHQFPESENQSKMHQESNNIFNWTSLIIISVLVRHFDFCLFSLDILVTQDCMIENIFLTLQCNKKGVSSW